MTPTDSKPSDPRNLRRFRACVVVIAGYAWFVFLVAAAAVLLPVVGWHIRRFRIDAWYTIFQWHLCAAIFASLVFFGTRRARRASVWQTRFILVLLPGLLALSCDRLALLTYPPLASPGESAALFVDHPARLWALRPDAAAPGLNIHLNERATRGPIVPLEKNPGERRVVILGDSIAFGFGVADEEVFDRVAEGQLHDAGHQDITIVNLGVPGYAPWQELDLLRTEGLSYDPDLVVYAFCLNDVVAWFWRHVPTPAPLPFRHEFMEASGLLRFGRGAWHDARMWSARRALHLDAYTDDLVIEDTDHPGIAEAWAVMLDHVAQIMTTAKAEGRKFAIIIFPPAGHVRPDAVPSALPQRRLADFARKNDIPFLDLLVPLQRYCDVPGHRINDLFIDGWHLSARGHEVAAQAFAQFLEQLDLYTP